jgi:hypothetical protein
MARFTRGAAKLVGTNTRFIVDPTVIPKLATAAEMGAMLDVRATQAANAVRAIAPIGESDVGYRYIDGIEAVVQLGRRGLVGRVNANKWTSRFLEFGVYGRAPAAPLRRGVEMSGLRLGRER